MIRTIQDMFLYKLVIAGREVSAKEMQSLLDRSQGSIHSAAQNLLRRTLILKRTVKTGKSPRFGDAAFITYYIINPKKIGRVNEILKEELNQQ